MKKNVGTWDALLRITVGLVGVAWAVSRMSRWPYRTGFLTRSVLWLSAMKVAEGITRFCPVLYAMGLNTAEERTSRSIRWKRAAGGRAVRSFAGSSTAGRTAAEPTTAERHNAERNTTARDNTDTERPDTGNPEQAEPMRANAESAAEQPKKTILADGLIPSSPVKRLNGAAKLPPNSRLRPEPIRARQIRPSS